MTGPATLDQVHAKILRNTLPHAHGPDPKDADKPGIKAIMANAAMTDVFDHEGTLTMVKRLCTSPPQLFDYLFLSQHPYDSICFAAEDWKTRAAPEDYGTYYTHYEFSLLIWGYILKRGTAIRLIQAEGYRITWGYTCKTDDALTEILKVFLEPLHAGALVTKQELLKDTHEIKDHGRTVMITKKQVLRALKAFTELPIKFTVQTKIGQNWQREEVVVIKFKAAEPEGMWDTEWEFMSKGLAGCLHPDSAYAFKERATGGVGE
ncbi:hypothetical protein LTR37_002683 [Vermiconidia calcicola]|uniref:Uncharacterized protein n=1 Tax=Vermiconidia calcicola TaxID=1690605 RepID=A0ACC3NSK4_9PEZI|nr:hypothetical protein LTR37_002683 [Vermiconidia calcicola]